MQFDKYKNSDDFCAHVRIGHFGFLLHFVFKDPHWLVKKFNLSRLAG